VNFKCSLGGLGGFERTRIVNGAAAVQIIARIKIYPESINLKAHVRWYMN